MEDSPVLPRASWAFSGAIADLDYSTLPADTVNPGLTGVSVAAQSGSFVDLDKSHSRSSSSDDRINQRLLWQRASRIVAAAAASVDPRDDELMDLRRQNQRLIAKLQASQSHARRLEQSLAQQDEAQRKLRQELLVREFWCRQVGDEAEQEAARSDWLLRRCHDLQDHLAAATAATSSPRLGRRLSANSGGTSWRSQQPPPPPPTPPASRSTKKPLSAARQLLSGRCSFKMKKPRAPVGTDSASTVATASSGVSSAGSGCLRLETDV